MDSSTFVANQTQFSVFVNPNANSNDQSVDFGPIVFNVLDAVSKSLGGVEYLIGELKPLVQNWHDPQIFSLVVCAKTKISGLSLQNPSDPMISQLAASSQSTLGDELDAWLLGNVSASVADCSQVGSDHFSDPAAKQEPDLYSTHGQRPNLANYTVDDYISVRHPRVHPAFLMQLMRCVRQDYNTVFNQLRYSSIGDIVALDKIGGPTICCVWVH